MIDIKYIYANQNKTFNNHILRPLRPPRTKVYLVNILHCVTPATFILLTFPVRLTIFELQSIL